MMRTIILQGQPYIVGLRWSPTEGLSKSAIIAEAIASQKYDRLILLDDQYGLADCGGKKGDVRALAAVIRFKEEGTSSASVCFVMSSAIRLSGGGSVSVTA